MPSDAWYASSTELTYLARFDPVCNVFYQTFGVSFVRLDDGRHHPSGHCNYCNRMGHICYNEIEKQKRMVFGYKFHRSIVARSFWPPTHLWWYSCAESLPGSPHSLSDNDGTRSEPIELTALSLDASKRSPVAVLPFNVVCICGPPGAFGIKPAPLLFKLPAALADVSTVELLLLLVPFGSSIRIV